MTQQLYIKIGPRGIAEKGTFDVVRTNGFEPGALYLGPFGSEDEAITVGREIIHTATSAWASAILSNDGGCDPSIDDSIEETARQRFSHPIASS